MYPLSAGRACPPTPLWLVAIFSSRWARGILLVCYPRSAFAGSMNGIYARVYGHLKALDGRRTVLAFRVTQLEEFNEVTHHLLSVMHLHKLRVCPAAGSKWGVDSPLSKPGAGQGNCIFALLLWFSVILLHSPLCLNPHLLVEAHFYEFQWVIDKEGCPE